MLISLFRQGLKAKKRVTKLVFAVVIAFTGNIQIQLYIVNIRKYYILTYNIRKYYILIYNKRKY